MQKETEIYNLINDLATKISDLLNRENIEEEIGYVLTYILEEADEHLMNHLEYQEEEP
ncbi:hypothetical protein [Thiolapillus sp.]|uniref:hypothetical protein n=1 Tax=Thiolapillus sp. TaxID=2017437 RepID=UPI003AF8F1E0